MFKWFDSGWIKERKDLYSSPSGLAWARTPYFVDKTRTVDMPVHGDPDFRYCLLGAGMSKSGHAAVLGWFRRLRDAKAEAERLASKRVLPEG